MTRQHAIPAVYMRGGTSRALIFHAGDLPDDRTKWDAIFAAALGSPDAASRQLDGLGGGMSSLSKVAVVAAPTRPDADVDFTFGQVAIDGVRTSYKGSCGNISAAIGPFAVEEGLVAADAGSASVRIHNTNTGKIIRADFPVANGSPTVDGDLQIAGVAGSGAPIRLAFVDPGGATTGRLLPTGNRRDALCIDSGPIEVSLIDAANPVVFVTAATLGLQGDEAPSAIAGNAPLMHRLEQLRIAAAVTMGVAADTSEAAEVVTNLPLVAIVSAIADEAADIRVRMISAGQPHKATPLTGALCLAVAAALPGTVVDSLVKARNVRLPFRIAHPGGVLDVDAVVEDGVVREAVVYRTARRLMQGAVLVPERIDIT